MTFTLPQISAFVVAAIGVTLTVLNIIDKSTLMKERAAKPMKAVEDRLHDLEKWRVGVDLRLEEGNNRFKNITESNAVTQRALLALMDNAMDESQIEELRAARKELYSYLSQVGKIS